MKMKAYDTQKTLAEKYFDFFVTDSDIPLVCNENLGNETICVESDILCFQVSFVRNRDNGYVTKENSLPLDVLISYPRNRAIDLTSIKFFALPNDNVVINCSYPNASAFSQTLAQGKYIVKSFLIL